MEILNYYPSIIRLLDVQCIGPYVVKQGVISSSEYYDNYVTPLQRGDGTGSYHLRVRLANKCLEHPTEFYKALEESVAHTNHVEHKELLDLLPDLANRKSTIQSDNHSNEIPDVLHEQQFGSKVKKVPPRQIRIAVEGNIASGKTSLLEMLSKLYKAKVFVEPVKKWQNLGGASLLGRVYQDPNRWGYLFLSYVLLTMLEQHHIAQSEEVPLIVTERSLFSSKHYFVDAMHQDGQLDDMEYACLQHWYDYIIATNKSSPDLIVYLKTTPETCLERLKHRARDEETTVTLEYLKGLHNTHEQWLGTGTRFTKQYNIPVLVLDGEVDLQTDSSIHKKFSEKIVQELSQLGIV